MWQCCQTFSGFAWLAQTRKRVRDAIQYPRFVLNELRLPAHEAQIQCNFTCNGRRAFASR
eukprot:4286296-Amphidinium_carterae.1